MALQNIIFERSDYIIPVLQGRNTNSLVAHLSESEKGEKRKQKQNIC
jgi:nitroimidazol reductase NimA-like FMN-containing flavoprotein (pyridoxamine 5'-phosphate oxidase superfamily)